jgi:hypothetical protein
MLTAFRCYGNVSFGYPLAFRYIHGADFNALTEGIEPILHQANTLQKARVDQSGDRFTILVNDNAIVPILNLVKHLTQVLSKGNDIRLDNHGTPPI